MIKLSDFIVRLRAMTHDEREIEYKDEDWIRYTNDALRFVRRIIFDIYPSMLADMLIDGFLTPPEKIIYLYETPIHILNVRVDGKRLKLINPHSDEWKEHNEPYGWYLLGFDKIRIMPAPKRYAFYEVTGVQDFQPLTKVEEFLPIPSEFEDFVSEYCVMRASVTNEFNMQDEAQFTVYIRQEIENRLKSFLVPGVDVRGYW